MTFSPFLNLLHLSLVGSFLNRFPLELGVFHHVVEVLVEIFVERAESFDPILDKLLTILLVRQCICVNTQVLEDAFLLMVSHEFQGHVKNLATENSRNSGPGVIETFIHG
jgi:hypothetical protein